MVKVIAFGTGRFGYIDLFKASCHRYDIDPVFLGWGDPWIGSGKKLTDIRDYLLLLPENEIVISVDPFDTIFLCRHDEIVEKYESCRTEFLCGAIRLDGFLKRIYEIEFNRSGIETPKAVTGYNYLNAGTWISRAGYAVSLISDLENKYNMSSTDIDQQFLTEAYLNKRQGMDLDRECILFSNPLTPGSTHLAGTPRASYSSNLLTAGAFVAASVFICGKCNLMKVNVACFH